MKTKILVVLLCLAFVQARAEVVKPFTDQPALLSAAVLPPEDPDPPLLSCIMTVICIGVFCLGLYACYWNGMHKGQDMTNKPPEDYPPVVPDTNTVPSNIYPAMASMPLNAGNAFSWSECDSNGWKDPQGSLYRIIRSTTIQSSPNMKDWTNALTVLVWESDAGTMTVMQDAAGQPVWTNYASRSGAATTNRAPYWLIDFSAERKFFRCTP